MPDDVARKQKQSRSAAWRENRCHRTLPFAARAHAKRPRSGYIPRTCFWRMKERVALTDGAAEDDELRQIVSCADAMSWARCQTPIAIARCPICDAPAYEGECERRSPLCAEITPPEAKRARVVAPSSAEHVKHVQKSGRNSNIGCNTRQNDNNIIAKQLSFRGAQALGEGPTGPTGLTATLTTTPIAPSAAPPGVVGTLSSASASSSSSAAALFCIDEVIVYSMCVFHNGNHAVAPLGHAELEANEIDLCWKIIHADCSPLNSATSSSRVTRAPST